MLQVSSAVKDVLDVTPFNFLLLQEILGHGAEIPTGVAIRLHLQLLRYCVTGPNVNPLPIGKLALRTHLDGIQAAENGEVGA